MWQTSAVTGTFVASSHAAREAEVPDTLLLRGKRAMNGDSPETRPPLFLATFGVCFKNTGGRVRAQHGESTTYNHTALVLA